MDHMTSALIGGAIVIIGIFALVLIMCGAFNPPESDTFYDEETRQTYLYCHEDDEWYEMPPNDQFRAGSLICIVTVVLFLGVSYIGMPGKLS